MANGLDVLLHGACVKKGAQQCQEILETMSLEKMPGKFEVQILLYQGNLMDAVLD